MSNFFIDENLPDDLCKPLAFVFKAHRFRSCKTENLLSWDDEPLFEELELRNFYAIITMDSHQLENANERLGLRQAGLHWVGLEQPKGRGEIVIAHLSAMIMAGLPHVLSSWEPDPHLYKLTSSVIKSSVPVIEKL